MSTIGQVKSGSYGRVRTATPGVVVKTSHDADSDAQVERQVGILRRLDHPNIVTVIDSGRTDAGRAWYSMPALGPPLDRACDGHSMRIDDRLRLFGDVLDAAEHIHARSMTHAGLHLDNVLADVRVRGLRAVVIDVEDYQDGTVAEDLRRLGVILRRLLVGGPILGSELPSEVFEPRAAVFRQTTPAELHAVAARFDDVVSRCFGDGFRSVAELRAAVDAVT